MKLDLTGAPLIDRPDFDELLEQGVFGKWSQEAISLHQKGYCLVKPESHEHKSRVEAVVKELEPKLKDQLKNWEIGACGSPRIQDGWRDHPSVRALALDEMVLDLLQHLYGRRAFAFQTLNFAVGSQQHYHSDAVHFSSYPLGYMCGVWFALQDVDINSGPLHYFPGSHRLPYLSAHNMGLTPKEIAAEQHPQILFEPKWHQLVMTEGLTSQKFLAKKGEIFVWHANLLHGGEPVNNRNLRRWSQVVHYFFDGCLYNTPMHSYGMKHGGASLRNPLDVATRNRRYSPAEWRQLGLESPAT